MRSFANAKPTVAMCPCECLRFHCPIRTSKKDKGSESTETYRSKRNQSSESIGGHFGKKKLFEYLGNLLLYLLYEGKFDGCAFSYSSPEDAKSIVQFF